MSNTPTHVYQQNDIMYAFSIYEKTNIRVTTKINYPIFFKQIILISIIY